MGRDDHSVGESLRPLCHGPVPGDAVGGQGFRVAPRHSVMDGHDHLVTTVESIVPIQWSHHARRVEHPLSGQSRETVLPCRGELSPGERALEEVREPGELPRDLVVVALGRRGDEPDHIAP